MTDILYRALFTQNPCAARPKPLYPRGVMVHSVGCKGTSFPRWQRWDTPSAQKSVHYFIDGAGIYQVLEDSWVAWHAGGSANNTHIAMEICEPWTDTPENGAELYGKVLYLCTALCRAHSLPADSVISHAEGHARGIASNHSDPDSWWRGSGVYRDLGISMDRLRADVAASLQKNTTQEETKMKEYLVAHLPAGDPGLNLRDRPNGSTVLEVLPEGTRVTDTGLSSGGWKQVRRGETLGWVWSTYLEEAPAGETPSLTLPRDLGEALYAALGRALKGG